VVAAGEPGIYEQLVTERLDAVLGALDPTLVAVRRPLDPTLVADRVALHLGREIERALADVADEDRSATGLAVARAVLDAVGLHVDGTEDGRRDVAPIDPLTQLRAVLRRLPDGSVPTVPDPLTPVLDTTLLTNAPGEPTLWRQLGSELASADAVDVIMAFIRRSGIRPLLEPLRRHLADGKPVRVLTTTYTGSTERDALEQLAALGADIRVSYDHGSTRLHAKAWIFHRRNGFSTAFVGSSNLTHTAQVGGLEWNVRASGARNPDVIAKCTTVFESYWAADEFVPYRRDEFDAVMHADRDQGPALLLPPTELHPRPFQARLLDRLELARRRGHHRNLLVSATGTGKTVMAALDYAALRARLPRARLLFVAHRAELLDQSRATFRHALRDATFGERWVDGERPRRFEHVFASVQSLAAADLSLIDPRRFDVVVIDEFHHAAAPSYERILRHLEPVELLGLTATPERADGMDVLHWFDGRIAADLRLWDAIDQQLLVPFQYYGIHDGLDLQTVPWTRGRGYDADALTAVITADDVWARRVVTETARHADVRTMRALGFCVSVEHARFMARHFAAAGIPAVAVSGTTPRPEREAALRDLAAGTVRAVFSVEVFNEGVDVPAVDTVLLLRPTESATLFLQQLGRGLRRNAGKAVCTVLDFIGHHRREFRFDLRLRALLGGTRAEVIRTVEHGVPYLPAGCHLELDPVAARIVLDHLRHALPSTWSAKVSELRALRQDDPTITLGPFLTATGLDLDDVYAGGRSWSDLQRDAGAPIRAPGPHEATLRRAIGRLRHVDDPVRLDAWSRLVRSPTPPAFDRLPERDRRLVHQLVASLGDQAVGRDRSVASGAELIWRHPQVLAELGELFDVLTERIDHIHRPLATHPDCPLQIHARYTRIEILTGFGLVPTAKAPAWQSGVYDAEAAGADLLAVTLDKSDRGFTPTTRYRDYALSRTLFHWESQSRTRADSDTGRRYRTHEAQGRQILLFVRERIDDRAFWFLGPARYRSHVGERPMAITWELAHPLPGDLFETFAVAVA
jgi:superfamily II DNA or RNA helicase/HKD family nuclease